MQIPAAAPVTLILELCDQGILTHVVLRANAVLRKNVIMMPCECEPKGDVERPHY